MTKKETRIFQNAVVFNDVTTTNTSASFCCASYTDFLLEIALTVGGAPTDIKIDLEFSDDNVTFYKLQNGPFGYLKYEDTSPPLNESISGKCGGIFIRITATATGTGAATTFTLTTKIIFMKNP